MKIRAVKISNFRLFNCEKGFSVNDLNVPDGVNQGSGLTVFVGENGCGKTSLLDAMSLPMLAYKADGFEIGDFNDPAHKAVIEVFSDANFSVSGTMPKGAFLSKGFVFEAGIRARATKAYLSNMVVSDQKFLRADGEEKPKDGSPDLRVGVNNPFKGKRFDGNDVLFLDKNRTYQTRAGTYNPTRFDRLMDDFNYQYVKKNTDDVSDLSERIGGDIKTKVENNFLGQAVAKFKEISGYDVKLNVFENWKPFSSGFFAETRDNSVQVNINKMGSGYEMVFSLIYSFYLAQQSGKELIAFIDEPELHLHPILQGKFVEFLLEISSQAQIILTSHSPLFIKQLLYSGSHSKIYVLKLEKGVPELSPMDSGVLPYVSANEINYLAFGLPTEEYHNELYEELKGRKGDKQWYKEFDKGYFIDEVCEEAGYPWKGNANEVSLHTFIRNQIHHRKDNGSPDFENLRTSIVKMNSLLGELTETQND